MSKTRQCLKTLNGGNLDTVQEFWDSSGILGQFRNLDTVQEFWDSSGILGQFRNFGTVQEFWDRTVLKIFSKF